MLLSSESLLWAERRMRKFTISWLMVGKVDDLYQLLKQFMLSREKELLASMAVSDRCTISFSSWEMARDALASILSSRQVDSSTAISRVSIPGSAGRRAAGCSSIWCPTWNDWGTT